MARKKKITLKGTVGREKAEEAFSRYADADARREEIQAKMDQRITKIREKYADDLDDLNEVCDLAFAEMQAYAEDHDELFDKRKSIEMAHGVIGFRTGTPKLKTLKGFTWKASLQLIKEFLPDYVKVKESPAKDKLLADREKTGVGNLFDKVGITVHQDESFYVDPKKEKAVS